MFRWISQAYKYIRLIYSIHNYINHYNRTQEHDIDAINNIITKVKDGGAVVIKFVQWSIPKLEAMSAVTEKPPWLIRLESLYEDCNHHSMEYTIKCYNEIYNKDFNSDYEIIDVIGSGSIGQVYLIQNKPLTKFSIREKYVMKVRHPGVKRDIDFFSTFYTLSKYIPGCQRLLKQNFPFDIYNFIEQFREQIDFINESNNLLRFKECYKDNDYIIIPELINCSPSIMIMKYEEGVSFDDMDIDSYQKYKIAVLLSSFTKNNMQILNFHHGDLHKGNWKIKIEKDNHHRLIIYDFGFCWSVPEYKIGVIDKLRAIFEHTDSDTEIIDLDSMTTVFTYFIKYDKDNADNIKRSVLNHLEENINEIKPWRLDPSRLFKMACDICISKDLLIDPILIQAVIILIQCEKIFSKFNLIGTDKDELTSRVLFRSKYLDLIALYDTYDIFREFNDYLKEILNEKQMKLGDIFDSVEMPESIKNLALLK